MDIFVVSIVLGIVLLGLIILLSDKVFITDWKHKNDDDSEPVNIEITPRVRKVEVDPQNPPRVMIYNPAPGFDEVYTCSCCKEEIEPGQEIVWFPVKGSDAVELYCPDKVDISEQDS